MNMTVKAPKCTRCGKDKIPAYSDAAWSQISGSVMWVHDGHCEGNKAPQSLLVDRLGYVNKLIHI